MYYLQKMNSTRRDIAIGVNKPERSAGTWKTQLGEVCQIRPAPCQNENARIFKPSAGIARMRESHGCAVIFWAAGILASSQTLIEHY